MAPATWYLKQGIHDCLIGIQVDDLLLCASTGGFAILAYIRAGLERILNIKLKWEPNPQDVVGLRMDRDRATKRMQLSMQQYIEEAVTIYAPWVKELDVDENIVPSLNAELLEIKPLPIAPGAKLTKPQKLLVVNNLGRLDQLWRLTLFSRLRMA